MGNNKLKKSLNLNNLIAMAAGGMIAAWMVEEKLWFELSGAGSIFSLLTIGLLTIPLCFIYAEMTSMIPKAGGENIWVTNALGWNTGFLTFWLVMLLYIMAMPVVSYGIASMFEYFYPLTNMQVKVVATIILLLWYLLTNLEIKLLARIQSILFWSTLSVSLVASTMFVMSDEWSFRAIEWFPNGFSGYSAAVGLLIMKVVGFDLIPQLAEESKFPKEKLWIAFLGSLGLTMLVYCLAVFGVAGIVTREWVLNTDIVDPRVADIIGLHWIGLAIVILGIGTCITTLSSFWLSAARTILGAAEQHQITMKLGKINKNGQPYIANIVVGILSVYFTIFAPDAWINYLYTIYGVAAGTVYLLVVVSFLKLRKTQPDWERPYKVRFTKTAGIVGILFTVYVLWVSAQAMDFSAWLATLIYLGLGVPAWIYAKKKQKSDPENWAPVTFTPEVIAENNKAVNE